MEASSKASMQCYAPWGLSKGQKGKLNILGVVSGQVGFPQADAEPSFEQPFVLRAASSESAGHAQLRNFSYINSYLHAIQAYPESQRKSIDSGDLPPSDILRTLRQLSPTKT
mgnify:CR=1 FL=1